MSVHSETSSAASLRSWVETVNTASGLSVVQDSTYDDVNADNASTFSSDLSTLNETDDDISDSLTTVTYMSDFTIFLDESDDEDTLTTVTSLSNFTIFLDDSDDEDTAMTVLPLSGVSTTNKLDESIVHIILEEIIALAL